MEDRGKTGHPAYTPIEEPNTEPCAYCLTDVPEDEIKAVTDYHGKTCGCQEIDFCDCGEPRNECEACKTTKL